MKKNSHTKFDFSELQEDTLNYIVDDGGKVVFVIKLPDLEFYKFTKNDKSEIFINILDDGFLSFEVAMLSVRNSSKYTAEIRPSYKENPIISKEIESLIYRDVVELIVISFSDDQYKKELTIFDNDKLIIRKWLGEDVEISKGTVFCKDYDIIPEQVIIPQVSETKFWFMCKTTTEIFNCLKNDVSKITFEVSIINGYLLFQLKTNNYVIGNLVIESSSIVQEIKDDFKLFVMHKVITFIISDKNAMEDLVMPVHTQVTPRMVKLIKAYMNI